MPLGKRFKGVPPSMHQAVMAELHAETDCNNTQERVERKDKERQERHKHWQGVDTTPRKRECGEGQQEDQEPQGTPPPGSKEPSAMKSTPCGMMQRQRLVI